LRLPNIYVTAAFFFNMVATINLFSVRRATFVCRNSVFEYAFGHISIDIEYFDGLFVYIETPHAKYNSIFSIQGRCIEVCLTRQHLP
jgi:hypothetical protein